MSNDDIKSKSIYDTGTGPNFVTFPPGTAKLLSGSGIYHNSLNVWGAASATREQRFVGHAMPITGVASSRGGKVLASTSRDGMLRIWDRDGNQLHQIAVAVARRLAGCGLCAPRGTDSQPRGDPRAIATAGSCRVVEH